VTTYLVQSLKVGQLPIIMTKPIKSLTSATSSIHSVVDKLNPLRCRCHKIFGSKLVPSSVHLLQVVASCKLTVVATCCILQVVDFLNSKANGL
jgi:hypothetical protein